MVWVNNISFFYVQDSISSQAYEYDKEIYREFSFTLASTVWINNFYGPGYEHKTIFSFGKFKGNHISYLTGPILKFNFLGFTKGKLQHKFYLASGLQYSNFQTATIDDPYRQKGLLYLPINLGGAFFIKNKITLHAEINYAYLLNKLSDKTLYLRGSFGIGIPVYLKGKNPVLIKTE